MKKQHNTYYYQTIRALKRKLYLIDLRGGKCEECGYDKNLAAFDFHHKDPKTKEFQLDSRSLSNYTMKRILSEFEKCLSLCSVCHREWHNPNLDIEKIRQKIDKYDEHILDIRGINKPHCLDCGVGINYTCIRCVKCNNIHKRKVKWPDFETLISEKNNNGFNWCAKKYNVSPKTIRRWITRLKNKIVRIEK